jgi:hypothetical protein
LLGLPFHISQNFDASRKFGVDRRLISQWFKNKERIVNSKLKRKRFIIKDKNNKPAFQEKKKRRLSGDPKTSP